MSVAARLARWAFQMLVCLDQLFACWVRGWAFVWRDDEEPSPDETFSSWIGRGAVAGHRWALVAERIVDFWFGQGHCRKSIGQ